MRTFGIIAVALTLLIAGVIGWYKASFPTYSYRYRLTISVELDGKVHTGSSVIEILHIGQPHIPDAGSFIPQVRGQAAFVDLGPAGAIVAALGPGTQQTSDSPNYAVPAVWLAARAFGNQSTYKELPELEKLHGRRDLTSSNMPRLIWFPNIADPMSAKPFAARDVAGLLGPSARVVAAHVEITDTPVFIDIDKKFPWFNILNRPLSQGVIQVDYGFSLAKTMFIGAAS